MGFNTLKRKHFRRKLKRRAAALAGVAMITGATLSGIPVTKAQAAEGPSHVPPLKTKHTASFTKEDQPPGRGWHTHDRSWPGPNDNQAWYEDGKIYYRSDTNHDRYDYVDRLDNPVDYVINQASAIGFNSARATFTLLTVTSNNALVEVKQHDTGKLFNVLLHRTDDGGWRIVEVRTL